MILDSIYESAEHIPGISALELLYRILQQRDDTTSISHRVMPSWDQHVAFVLSCPYRQWWLVVEDVTPVGAAYLSKANEIGVFILKEYQGRGYGTKAVRMIMSRYRDIPLFANINPGNARSIRLFEGLGFRHLQNTYRLEPSGSKTDAGLQRPDAGSPASVGTARRDRPGEG